MYFLKIHGKSICLWTTLLPFNSHSSYFLNPKWFHVFPALEVLLPWTQALFVCVFHADGWSLSSVSSDLRHAAVKCFHSSPDHIWDNVEFKEALSVLLRGRKSCQIHSFTHWSNILYASYELGILLGIPKTGWSSLFPWEAYSAIGRQAWNRY